MAEPRIPGPTGLVAKPTPRPGGLPASPAKKTQPGPIGVGAKKATPPVTPNGANLGAQVVAFAEGKSRERVGDGQCFSLADRALRNAGAKSAADFGLVTEEADYVWGTQVSLADVRAGDIVQFRDYEFKIREEREDGSDETFGDRPHHTAIVKSVDGPGLLTVIEQNVTEKSPVRNCQLGFSNTSFVKGKATIIVTMSGTVWFYRPQAK